MIQILFAFLNAVAKQVTLLLLLVLVFAGPSSIVVDGRLPSQQSRETTGTADAAVVLEERHLGLLEQGEQRRLQEESGQSMSVVNCTDTKLLGVRECSILLWSC